MKNFAIRVVDAITQMCGIIVGMFGCGIAILAQAIGCAAYGLIKWGSELADFEMYPGGKYAKKY